MTQEWSEVDHTREAIVHQPLQCYFVNMHAIHNANILCETLPRHLTQPTPLYTDGQALHKKLALGLCITGPLQCQRQLQKAAETWAQKKKE